VSDYGLDEGKCLQKHLLNLNQYLESQKPQLVGPFLRGSNYNTRYGTNVAGHRQSKLMMAKPSQSLAADVLRLSRTQIMVLTGLMTGHCNLRKLLHTMGIFKENQVCRLCNEEEETTSDIVFECEALAHR
jgi:hypothetical protein